MNLLKKSTLLRFLNIWPPYLGAGVRVRSISPNFRKVMVEMPLRWWNRNYVGTHFGGSLYSMVDPFYMLMLIENLGSRYVVWDKAATIRFQRPGRGRVRAEFSLEEEHILQIQRDVESHGKSNPRFVVQVKNDEGETVAEIEKTLSIKLRS